MATTDPDSIIGELAVKRGYITQAQLGETTRWRASAHSGISLGQALVKQGLLSESDLASLLREREEALRETTRPGRVTEHADSRGTVRAADSSGHGPSASVDSGSKQGEGVSFGHYRLLQELGRGAMGKVFKACDTKLNRIVALKQILLEDSSEHELIARFMREARVAARLKHPNIVSVHDVGEVDGKHYFTMDYIEGQSLSALFERARAASLLSDTGKAATAKAGERPSSPQDATQLADSAATVLESPARDSSTATRLGTEAKAPDAHGLSMRKGLELIRDIAGALHHAHEAGVVHRDIKPANVLVDGTGRPYITDFGLAKDISVRDTSRLTHSGALMGTPVYMSPEQAAGKVHMIGPHSDQYSLGAVMYELLTGMPPFDEPSLKGLLVAIVEKEPPPPRSLNARVPPDVETICLKALQKEPAQRYGNIGEMAEDITLYLEGEPIKARPAGKLGTLLRKARRNARTLVPTCIAGLLLVALAAWLILASLSRAEKLKGKLEEAAAFERNGRQVEARDSFLAALELDGDNETAGTGFARVKGRLEAIEAARESERLEAEVKKRRAEDNLARLNAHMRLIDEGRAPLDKAILFLYRKDSSYAELLEMLETSKLKFEQAIEKTPEFAPAYFMLGRTWYFMGWLDKADECYRKAIERDPGYRQACCQIGRLLLERAFTKTLGATPEQRAANRAEAESLTKEATAFLEKAEEPHETDGGPRGEDPTEMDKALAAAMLAYAKGDSRQSVELCSAAIGKFGKKLGVEDFYWLHGASTFDRECVGDFTKAIELRPKFPLALFCRAIARKSQGDLAGAQADYTEAIEFCPRLIEAYTNRAGILHTLGNSQSAIADLDKALAIDPEYAEAYCTRSGVRIARGDFDGAIEDATRAFALKPALAEAIINRGNARMYKRDFKGAIADFTQAIDINPMFAKAFFNRASATYYSGDLQGAIADYSRAIEVEPGFAEAYLNRANLMYELGELDKAFADYSESLRLKPGFATALANRGNVRYEKGDKAGALADYDAAIEADPQYATPRLNRGHARHDAGDFDGAITDFSEAIRLNPEYANAYYFRGVARHCKGDVQGAVSDLAEFVRRVPDDADGYLARGKALADAGDSKGAAEDIEKALRIAPQDWTLRGEAEERLKTLRKE